jgi:hypothetical protein
MGLLDMLLAKYKRPRGPSVSKVVGQMYYNKKDGAKYEDDDDNFENAIVKEKYSGLATDGI